MFLCPSTNSNLCELIQVSGWNQFWLTSTHSLWLLASDAVYLLFYLLSLQLFLWYFQPCDYQCNFIVFCLHFYCHIFTLVCTQLVQLVNCIVTLCFNGKHFSTMWYVTDQWLSWFIILVDPERYPKFYWLNRTVQNAVLRAILIWITVHCVHIYKYTAYC